MATFGNSAGEASGLRKGSTWNYGFLGGVRKLREEEEARNIIKGSTMPPGAKDYLSQAWNQWNGGAHAEGSGYETDPKHWATRMAMPRLRPGTEGAVNGFNPNWDYEEAVKTRSTLSARVKSKVHVKPLEPGTDGVVEAGVYAVEDEEEGEARVPPPVPRQPRLMAQIRHGAPASTLSVKGGAKTAKSDSGTSRLSVATGWSAKLLKTASNRQLAQQIRALHRRGGGGGGGGGGGDW